MILRGTRIGLILLLAAVPPFVEAAPQVDIIENLQVLEENLHVLEGNSPYRFTFAGTQKAGLTPLLARVQGTFWRDPAMVTTLGLTAEQQQRMDGIFRQHRINLVDLNAAVEKEELILEPLVEELPGGDQARIMAQIDSVAQARAELEKANARMLVSILQVMTPDQVSKLPRSHKPSLLYFPSHF